MSGAAPIRGVVAALAALPLSGCGADESVSPVPGHFDWLVERAEQVRELPLLEEVTYEQVSRDEYLARVAERIAERDPAVYEAYHHTYGRMGYFGPELDIPSLIVERQKGFVGVYEHSKNHITMIDEWRDDVIVHELTHALQHQHFDLAAYDNHASTEAFLARRAGSEGDADLARERFIVQERDGIDLPDVDWSERLPGEIKQRERVLDGAEVPLYFEAFRSFAYPHGFLYAAHNLMGVSLDAPEPTKPAPFDWEPQNRLLAEPWLGTTEEVLTLGEETGAFEVGLDHVPEALEARLEATDWDTLGSWYVFILLRPTVLQVEADDMLALASTWDGDRVLFVRDLERDVHGFVWTSRWESIDAALEMEAALRRLYGVGPSATETTAVDGEPVRFERRNHELVVVKNVESDLAEALVNASFEQGGVSGAARRRPPLVQWLDPRFNTE